MTEFVPGQVWVQQYPIHFAGCDFNTRVTVIKISDTKLMLHSPCEIDPMTKEAISALGEVACIVAPGSYHHIHILSAQAAFPKAAARKSLQKILQWDFKTIVLSHGDLIETGAKETALRAWKVPLSES